MNILINKKPYEFAAGTNLQQALDALQNLPTSGFAVAIDDDVVPRQKWAETVLAENQRITIIKAFYGG